MKKPIVLCVIDGLGLRKEIQGNGYLQAKTPFLDKMLLEYPNSILKASGKFVGLPKGQIGNSEVGHLNIGAGEVVYTGLSLIQKSIDDGTFVNNKAFLKAIKFAQKNNGTIQIAGLLSPGGVHSLENHLFILLKGLYEQNIKKVTVHVFGDGRDVKPRSIKSSLEKLMNYLNKYGYHLGSIGGRLYAMDRDKNFDKTEIAFNAIQGKNNKTFDNVFSYLKDQYENQKNNDEFLDVAINSSSEVNFFKDGDSFIFFNFRQDRARQLSHLIIGSNEYDFIPKNKIKKTCLVTMMKYEGIDKAIVAFNSQIIKNPIGGVISNLGLKQLRIAETQKYAHVTFFIDGGENINYKNSQRIMVNSIKVDNFAKAPLMSATSITNKLINVLNKYDFVIINYANPDMVGHTGNLEATKIAVSHLDKELSKLKEAVDILGGTLFITSDHGNAEITEDKGGKPATKHTTSDVFLIVTDQNLKLKNGSLSNVAPTILDYMKIKKPKTMVKESLLIK